MSKLFAIYKNEMVHFTKTLFFKVFMIILGSVLLVTFILSLLTNAMITNNNDKQTINFSTSFFDMYYSDNESNDFGEGDEYLNLTNEIRKYTDSEEARKDNYYDVMEQMVEDDVQYSDSAVSTFSVYSWILSAFLYLFIAITVCTSISNELSSGSIKCILIAPIRRWKIYVGKYMAMLSMMGILTLIYAILTVTLTYVVYGVDALPAYYITPSIKIPSYCFYILYMIISKAQFILYATLAMMFSSITKKNAVSVCLTFLSIAGTSTLTSIFSIISTRFSQIFISSVFDPVTVFFPNEFLLSEGIFSIFNRTNFSTIIFKSPIYAVFFGLLLVSITFFIGFDHFIHSDIKS